MTEPIPAAEPLRTSRAALGSRDRELALIGKVLRRAAQEGNAGLLLGLAGTVADLLASLPARAESWLDDTVPGGSWPGNDAAAVDAPARAPESGRRPATAAYFAASVTGDLGSAEALLADARHADVSRPLSGQVALATAFVLLYRDGDVTAAHRLLVRAIDATSGQAVGARTAEEALRLLTLVCRLSGSAGHWDSLNRYTGTSGPRVTAEAGVAADIAGDPRTALRRLDAEVASLAHQTEPGEIIRIASVSAFADRLQCCRDALRQIARPERADSAGTHALQATVFLALEAYQTGQWDEADELAAAAAGLCHSRGYHLLHHQAQTVRALVAACRGDIGPAHARADEIAGWAAPRGISHLVAGARYARVLAALARSDPQTAFLQATLISAPGCIPVREPFAVWAVLDLVEAALRTGRRDDAAAHVQAVRHASLATVSARMALLSTAATAMIAHGDQATELFDQALAIEDVRRWPFDQARVHLLFGERLRRMGAKTAARAHLDAAIEGFAQLGAPTWAERATIELHATGRTRPRRAAPGGGWRGLSPQELTVARLAAAGLSNKQIASRLFLSPRTVGTHLYRIFPKLDITSRAALGAALPQDQH